MNKLIVNVGQLMIKRFSILQLGKLITASIVILVDRNTLIIKMRNVDTFIV